MNEIGLASQYSLGFVLYFQCFITLRKSKMAMGKLQYMLIFH